MASFVREVLSASGRLSEKEDYSGKATRLRSGIDDLKAGLRKKIEARYTDFSASSVEVSKQISYLDEVIREIENLETSIQNHVKPGLLDASRETNELLRQMRELSDSAKAANHISQVYELMESANQSIDQKHFMVATKKLKIIEDAIMGPVSPGQDCEVTAAFESIKIEFQTSQEKIRYALCQEWNQQVRIESVSESDVTIRSLAFGTKDSNSTFWCMIRAMHQTDTLSYRLNKFGSKLLTEIIQPLFKTATLSIESENSSYNTIIIKSRPTSPEPKKVLSALKEVFTLLGDFMNFCVDEENHGKTLIELLGEGFSGKVKDLIVKECLVPAVPNHKEGLDEYYAVISVAESLQEMLVGIKFCAANDSTIIAYARNVDTTFANKRCQIILGSGRKLMKEDLHDSKLVDEDHQGNKSAKSNLHTFSDASFLIANNYEDELLPLPKGMSLDKNLFTFPKCHVGLSVFKLLDLVKETLSEACNENTTPFFAERLLVTARNLIEMYCDVVPVYHADGLAKFPQLAALVYNNCYYIAHECLTLGLECSTNHKSPFKNRAITFADLIVRLRQTGVDVFLQQLRKQRDEIRSILKDSSGLGQLTGNDPLPPAAEKCIRQVLHQLVHLKKLWQNVLPSNIYCKSIGTLINTVIEDITQKVIVLDDIAADVAAQLSAMFSALKEQAPDLFVIDGDKESNRGDIIRFVKKWNKFNELILVLNTSLREIDDRWAGGKGPLAFEFSPEEVKRLIRALFQNSDRRAAVLARIKFE